MLWGHRVSDSTSVVTGKYRDDTVQTCFAFCSCEHFMIMPTKTRSVVIMSLIVVSFQTYSTICSNHFCPFHTGPDPPNQICVWVQQVASAIVTASVSCNIEAIPRIKSAAVTSRIGSKDLSASRHAMVSDTTIAKMNHECDNAYFIWPSSCYQLSCIMRYL